MRAQPVAVRPTREAGPAVTSAMASVVRHAAVVITAMKVDVSRVARAALAVRR